jgi:hypothetical protein
VERTEINYDDFDLDKIEIKLLNRLKKRWQEYLPATSQQTENTMEHNSFTGSVLPAAKARKNNRSFFKQKEVPNREIFALNKTDVEAHSRRVCKLLSQRSRFFRKAYLRMGIFKTNRKVKDSHAANRSYR